MPTSHLFVQDKDTIANKKKGKKRESAKHTHAYARAHLHTYIHAKKKKNAKNALGMQTHVNTVTDTQSHANTASGRKSSVAEFLFAFELCICS